MSGGKICFFICRRGGKICFSITCTIKKKIKSAMREMWKATSWIRGTYRIGAGRGGFDAKAIFIACGNRLWWRLTFRHRGGPTKIYSHFGLPTNKSTFVPSLCANRRFAMHPDTAIYMMSP